ncbi:MAG: hypothetical protein ACR2MX_17070 [Cyclobacteriaceae bacterium]
MEHFSQKELQYLSDRDFLLTKATITQKVKDMLANVEHGIKKQIEAHQVPTNVLTLSGKISKGENYQGLPYLMLDYPRKFNQEEVFAFRTMFWWGHMFSATLHLGGNHWEEHRTHVINRRGLLTDQGWYVCVNLSPWEYHYQPANYKLLDSLNNQELLTLLKTHPFLKLSKKWALNSYAQFPTEAIATFTEAMKLIDPS